ncbi:ABC transporter substrate-binding protein [Paraglaciecola aestuariivivens]
MQTNKGKKLSYRLLIAVCALSVFSATVIQASPSPEAALSEQSQAWQQTLKNAQGKSVFFYAWGGSKPVNDYIRWAAKEVAKQYRIKLVHVKVTDPAEAVARLEAENGRTSAIDLTWINGENFAFLKRQNRLLGDLWTSIPNAANLALDSLPISIDFGEPMDGYEVPWGIGQFNLIAEQSVFVQNQVSPALLLSLAKQQPQKLTYPRPPEFHGTTFLKQLLIGLSQSDPRLYVKASEESKHSLINLLFNYLDQLHPYLWQQGRAFPSSAAEQMLMYQQQNLVMAVSFNPNQWAKEQANKQISASSVRRYFAEGAITNSHNLAIPKFAANADAAKVVIHFLLSEQAQIQKFNGSWGDPAVIKALQNTKQTMPTHPELHSSWHVLIEDAWQQRYGG